MVRRQPTNTPLQALVTLNDPTFVEASKVLGEQLSKEANVAEGIKKIYRKLTGVVTGCKRNWSLLVKLQSAQLEKFKQDTRKAKGLAGSRAMGGE